MFDSLRPGRGRQVQERGNPALRRMDRWVGIPLIALLGLFRRMSRVRRKVAVTVATKADEGSKPAVITLLKSAAIGDTVLLSSVVRDLRAALPNCRLQLACGTSNAPLAKMVAGLDEVIVLPMSKPLQLWRLRSRLRSDILIDFDSWPRINALIAFGSGSTTTIGFRTPRQHRHALYDLAVDHSTALHEVENYRQLVRPLFATTGVTLDDAPKPWLQIPSPSTDRGEDRLATTIVFHMFAGGSQAPFKEWPESCWLVLARNLVEQGFQIRLSGGPADIERNSAFARQAGMDTAVSVLPVANLASLAAWLGSIAAVVTVDTGIAHLAGAAGARTLVLHGPTAPERWGALGHRVRYLKDAQVPWIQLGFEVSPTGTQVRLPVEEVRDAVIAIARC